MGSILSQVMSSRIITNAWKGSGNLAEFFIRSFLQVILTTPTPQANSYTLERISMQEAMEKARNYVKPTRMSKLTQ